MPRAQLAQALQLRVIDDYQQGATLAQVAYRVGCSSTAAYHALRRHEVARRSRGRALPCDHHFFHEIRTEEQAYWLGFITADGHVADHKMSIGLHVRDKGHLETLKRAMHAKHKISICAESASFEVRSKQLVADLRRLGLSRQKSKTARPATIAKQLLPAYYRGIVDGDGSIDTKHTKLRLAGTLAIAQGFQQFNREHGIDASVYPERSIYVCGVYGDCCRRCLRLLYAGATVALPRKYVAAVASMEVDQWELT